MGLTSIIWPFTGRRGTSETIEHVSAGGGLLTDMMSAADGDTNDAKKNKKKKKEEETVCLFVGDYFERRINTHFTLQWVFGAAGQWVWDWVSSSQSYDESFWAFFHTCMILVSRIYSSLVNSKSNLNKLLSFYFEVEDILIRLLGSKCQPHQLEGTTSSLKTTAKDEVQQNVTRPQFTVEAARTHFNLRNTEKHKEEEVIWNPACTVQCNLHKWSDSWCHMSWASMLELDYVQIMWLHEDNPPIKAGESCQDALRTEWNHSLLFLYLAWPWKATISLFYHYVEVIK